MEDNPLNARTHRNEDEDKEDPPTLSSQALAALREFLTEQNHSVTADYSSSPSSSVALVSEDWRLSQFWYDPDTAETVAHEVLTLCQIGSSDFEDSNSPRVACIACPTLYAYLKVPNFLFNFYLFIFFSLFL